jgi:hypothetical protein
VGFKVFFEIDLVTTLFFGTDFCLITFLVGFLVAELELAFVAGLTDFFPALLAGLGAALIVFFGETAFFAAVAAGFSAFFIILADGLDFLSFLMSFFLAIITALINLIFQ